jgi:uncharacterized damage-inducible protein DinB
MSIFSNPASRSSEDAKAYTTAILGLLGDRRPLDVLRATGPALLDAVRGLTDAAASTPEAPGKWSVRHVLQHLADSEVVWAWRMRLVLAQTRPAITGYDQDLWAERLGYDAGPIDEALEMFRVLRRSNLRLIERATPDDLARVGVHAERGEESVAHMMRLYAGHDLLHLQQIARIRRAVG